MAYKIAVASSDGVNVNVHFGAAKSFLIYDVDDNGTFRFAEKRDYDESSELENGSSVCEGCNGSGSGCGNAGGSGCAQGGCRGGKGSAKVQLISDVRAVIAEKIGFNVQKQFEKKAISSFDVDVTIIEALEKITKYFYSVDNHQRFGR